MRLPEHAAHAIRRLERAGFEAWAVGGCVRDSLRGVEPHDWDLCTSASPAQMQAVFADARVLTTGLRHGTLTVLTDGGPLEITTYRTEDGYSDGRHPDGVRFVTDIREDLSNESMKMIVMISEIEDELDVTIEIQEASLLNTLADFVLKVKEKM